jgi:hypothetical protein
MIKILYGIYCFVSDQHSKVAKQASKKSYNWSMLEETKGDMQGSRSIHGFYPIVTSVQNS